MMFFGLHLADWAVLVLYFTLVIWIGRRAASSVHTESDFFLSGRRLGTWLQFFLNFGQMTESSGAPRTSSVVYNSGVGGVWYGLQTLFMTPYYWFMNAWFRRARLTTVADLFTERFGGRTLALIYAIFTVFFSIFNIGASYLVAHKMIEVIVVKPASAYTATEKKSVVDYEEFVKYNSAYKKGQLDPSLISRYQELKSLREAGVIKPYVSYIDPLTFYLVFASVVGGYIVIGGMTAAAYTDALQGLLIVVFSCILIPFGLMHLGGLGAFHARLPDRMLQMFGSGGDTEFTWYSIAAIFLISIIQIHAVPGNMSVAGSARTEEAAAVGAISGGFMKRWMIIAWCICGLIAFAIFGQSEDIGDPDAVWGALCRTLLGPGFLGLMIAGLLAGDMSAMSSHSLTLSALFVRNVYQMFLPRTSDRHGLMVGRLFIVFTLLLGIGIAVLINSLISFLKIGLTLNVAFGAAILLIFKWRRITEAATIIALLISMTVIVIVPLVGPAIPSLTCYPTLHVMTNEQRHIEENAKGSAKVTVLVSKPIFFERIVKVNPGDPNSPCRGEGRFNFELYLASLLGVNFRNFNAAQLLAFQYILDCFIPFFLLIGLSLLTRAEDPARTERFYVKMRTRTVPDSEEDNANLAYSYAHAAETEQRKLFPGSNWEFQRWRKLDYLAFGLACLIALGILLIFFFILTLGRK